MGSRMKSKDAKGRKMGPEFPGFREAYNNAPREWFGTETNRLLHKVLETPSLFSMTEDDLASRGNKVVQRSQLHV